MERPYISIIVPIYNVEKYFDRCLNSITNQTLKNIEIILVDDESPDRCPQKCDEAAKKDKRIRVIHKKNEGLGFARNSGLEIATGEYVYFVDSDDYLELTAAEILYTTAKKENLEICFAGIILENDQGEKKRKIPVYAGKRFYQPELVQLILSGMLGSDPNQKEDTDLRMSAWQGIYKRDWLINNKLHFSSERRFISEDIIFHLDALPKASSLGYIENCLYYHIVDNPASLTHRYNPERFEKCCVLYLEEKKRIETLGNDPKMLLHAQRMFLGNTRVCLKQIMAKAEYEGKKFGVLEIKKIVNDKTLRSVLATYPYFQNPIRQRISSFLMDKKMVNIIYYLMKVSKSKRCVR